MNNVVRKSLEEGVAISPWQKPMINMLIWQLIIVRKSAAQILTTKPKSLGHILTVLLLFLKSTDFWWITANQENLKRRNDERVSKPRSCWWNFDAQSESFGPRWKKLCAPLRRRSSQCAFYYWALPSLLFATKSSAYRSQNSCSSL